MPLTMRPNRIAEEPPDYPDFTVLSGELNVGRIYEDSAINNPDCRWYWAINGVHAGPEVMQAHGRAPTLDEAKEALRENWNKWLAWAKLEEMPGEN